MQTIYKAIITGFCAAGCVGVTTQLILAGTLGWWMCFIGLLIVCLVCIEKYKEF